MFRKCGNELVYERGLSLENGGNEADVTEIVLAATLLIAVILFFFR